MQTSLLTSEDQQWLSKHEEAVRSSLNFMLADLLYPRSPRAMSRAHEVLIWYKGSFLKTPDLLSKIQKEVPYSQIYEQWESRVYQGVQRVCRSLSALDEKALIIVAGYDIITEDEINRSAAEAVSDAREALYGRDEDHC